MLIFRRNKKTLENLSRFKHAKFNYAKFVRNYYLENDEAYIVANVSSMDDIISRYSTPGQEWLTDDFTSYVDACAYHVPVEEAIVLEITGGHFTSEEQAVITRVVTDHYGLELGEKVIELRYNARRSILLLVLSIVTAVIFYLLFQYTESIFLELIVVGLWFFIWELGSVAWLERSDLRMQKLEAGQLASLRVQFVG